VTARIGSRQSRMYIYDTCDSSRCDAWQFAYQC